jgi:nucleoside-diphosphate-sugar epimerase
METMIEIIARLLSVNAPTRHMPVPVARLLALLFESRAKLFGGVPRMSRDMVQGFLANRAFVISKARQELGYEPRFSLAEGMKQTIEWYEAKGYL